MTCIRKRAPSASSETVRRLMQKNVGRETDPEKALRAALYHSGMRFRKNYRPIPNKRITVDIAIPKYRFCIFVDGCFWHSCPMHFAIPKTHSAWWREKMEDNRNRDIKQTRCLETYGWKVLRIWEHDLTTAVMPKTIRRLVRHTSNR